MNNIIFSELKVGDVFIFGENRYMKMEEVTDTNFLDLTNAIMLDKNVYDEEHEHPYCYFDDGESVIFISNITDLIGAKSMEFDDYDKARKFRDKVNGQIIWDSYEGKTFWHVSY